MPYTFTEEPNVLGFPADFIQDDDSGIIVEVSIYGEMELIEAIDHESVEFMVEHIRSSRYDN